MHHPVTPRNALKSESDTSNLESGPSGHVLQSSQCKGELVQPAPRPQRWATLSHPIWRGHLMAWASHTAVSPQHRCQSRSHSTRDVHCSTGCEAKSSSRQKQERCAMGAGQYVQGKFSADPACRLVCHWGTSMNPVHKGVTCTLRVKRQCSYRHQ